MYFQTLLRAKEMILLFMLKHQPCVNILLLFADVLLPNLVFDFRKIYINRVVRNLEVIELRGYIFVNSASLHMG